MPLKSIVNACFANKKCHLFFTLFQQLLLSNIAKLDNKAITKDPGSDSPPSITPDGKYLILTDVHVSSTESEQDVLEGAAAATTTITKEGDSEAWLQRFWFLIGEKKKKKMKLCPVFTYSVHVHTFKCMRAVKNMELLAYKKTGLLIFKMTYKLQWALNKVEINI